MGDSSLFHLIMRIFKHTIILKKHIVCIGNRMGPGKITGLLIRRIDTTTAMLWCHVKHQLLLNKMQSFFVT